MDFGEQGFVDAGSEERPELGKQVHAVGGTDEIDDSGWRWTSVAIGMWSAARDEHVVTRHDKEDALAQAYLVLPLQNDKRLLVSCVDVVADTGLAHWVPALNEGVAGVLTRLIQDLQSGPAGCAEGRSFG